MLAAPRHRRVRPASPGLCPKSRRSRRLKIAHRFIGGGSARAAMQSVKRTLNANQSTFGIYSVVRFTDSISTSPLFPAINRWAIFIRPLTRTQTSLFGKPIAGSVATIPPLLPSGLARKKSRAPRPMHGRRRHPCAPRRAPRPDLRLQVSRNRPCAPWSRCTARR